MPATSVPETFPVIYRSRSYSDADSLQRAKARYSCEGTELARKICRMYFSSEGHTKEHIGAEVNRTPAAITLQANKFVYGFHLDIELAMIVQFMNHGTAQKLNNDFAKAEFVKKFFAREIYKLDSPSWSHTLTIILNWQKLNEHYDWISALAPIKRQR